MYTCFIIYAPPDDYFDDAANATRATNDTYNAIIIIISSSIINTNEDNNNDDNNKTDSVACPAPRASGRFERDTIITYGFCHRFHNLRFRKSPNIDDLSATHVLIYFFSSEILKCWLLK